MSTRAGKFNDFEGPAVARFGPHGGLQICRGVPLDDTGLLLIGSIAWVEDSLGCGIVKELVLGKGIGCLFYDYREFAQQIQTRTTIR